MTFLNINIFRRPIKLQIVVVLIASLFLFLMGLGVWQAWTKESIEEKMCDNQKFTLAQLDTLASVASRLVSSSETNRSPDQVAAYLGEFERMRIAVEFRRTELDRDYC